MHAARHGSCLEAAWKLHDNQPTPHPGDDCGSGEMDWALADAMLGLLLYIGGGSDTVLRGRLHRTGGLNRARRATRTGCGDPGGGGL
jgi:hypothetical protein